MDTQLKLCILVLAIEVFNNDKLPLRSVWVAWTQAITAEEEKKVWYTFRRN